MRSNWAERHLLGIEGDLDGLGMAGIAVADQIIMGLIARAAGIAGHHLCHAFDMFEHALLAPKAAPGQHCDFGCGRIGWIGGRRRDFLIQVFGGDMDGQ